MVQDDDRLTKDKILAHYYGDEGVTALITLKADTQNVETLAAEISKHNDVEDVFLVTGDIDIIIKGHFQNYDTCNEFVLNSIRQLEGVKDTKTLMVVTTYKERGSPKQV
ncbi:MAG: Lrp/AsnC family transcriptional regulator [Methanomassiliicoccales archaeon]|nr:MAG: Lrp/AsnC family transcriptional regulator [Methanomassiliicoccales archaeon]